MGNIQVNHTPTRYDAEETPVKISNSYFDLGYADNYIRAYVAYRWEEQLYVFNIYDIRGYNLSDLRLISTTWCVSTYSYQ